MSSLAVAVAFFACGVVFFSTATLLLFNPRSRGVRWYALFQAGLMSWLAVQGWIFATGGTRGPLFFGIIHMLPAFFLAFALAEGMERPDWQALLPVCAGLVLLPFALHGERGTILDLWQLAAWVGGTVPMVRFATVSRRVKGPGERRLSLGVVGGMVAVLPLGLIGGYLTEGSHSVYALPLAMVWMQLLIFVGVSRLRFYDIEVRASRTGELAAAATEQERLAVLGELSASVAHEVRNPLTGMRSLAQRLAEDDVDDAKRRRYAAVILEEAERVERIVANLLGFARRATVRPEPGARTALAPLFDDLLLLVEAHARRGGVTVDADAGGSVAAAPREALAQAILNLLLNAIRHTPAGGTVRLAARPAQGDLEVVVSDTGPGVPPAERERIWEPFRSEGGGTGLGLAVVRRLARELGWEARVGGAPGGGAEFSIRIPAPQAAR
ncbi:MAG TPA: HAMP domain-containing sensor histidine kinase [Longimicrobium sp.]|jgi:signal transduction histidine kinase